MASRELPKDSFHCVGVIFFLLGLGTLLPWNFFITAIPYFQSRLVVGNCSAGEEQENGTTAGFEPVPRCSDDFNFSNWLALLSQLPLLLFTLLNSLLYQCIPEALRILGSLGGILFLFVLTAILVKVEMSPQAFFSVTMASVWFLNSFCAVLQGSIFGQLGAFPQRYSTLFLSGQGMAGTFAAAAMLLSMASGADPQTSALSYFVTPCVGTLISIICYLWLPHKDFARHYLDKQPQEEPGCEAETKAGLLSLEDITTAVPDGPQGELLNLSNGNAITLEQEDPGCPPEMMNGNSGAGLDAPPKPSVLGVLRKIWQLALCIVMVFSVTLSVFPAITASVASASENVTWNKFFTPVCCFLLFNVLDWLGRSATSYFLWVGFLSLSPPAREAPAARSRGGGPAPPLCPLAPPLQHPAAQLPAHLVPAGRLVHPVHGGLLSLQRLLCLPDHVPGAKVSGAAGCAIHGKRTGVDMWTLEGPR